VARQRALTDSTDGGKINEHCSLNGVQFNLTFQFVNLKMLFMGIAERKNRQKQALRERILDAARRIVMREGFAALSMRKIADAIEYSPATLYLHFASRDEIAHALCAEGYAQLLQTFVPLAGIVDAAERLKALGRAYVAFGVAHPQTYRLIFMEDPSYTGAALGGAVGAAKPTAQQGEEAADTAADPTAAGVTAAATASGTAATSADEATSAAMDATANAAAADDPGAAALHLMITAIEELKAAGRLLPSTDSAVWAEAFWATLHGIVALHLTCPVFPTAPLDTVLGVSLDAWLGAPQTAEQAAQAAQAIAPPRSVASATGGGKKKAADLQTSSPAEPGSVPLSPPSSNKPTKAAAKNPLTIGTKRKTTSP
jgi:AcrR family transcriptional regulator